MALENFQFSFTPVAARLRSDAELSRRSERVRRGDWRDAGGRRGHRIAYRERGQPRQPGPVLGRSQRVHAGPGGHLPAAVPRLRCRCLQSFDRDQPARIAGSRNGPSERLGPDRGRDAPSDGAYPASDPQVQHGCGSGGLAAIHGHRVPGGRRRRSGVPGCRYPVRRTAGGPEARGCRGPAVRHAGAGHPRASQHRSGTARGTGAEPLRGLPAVGESRRGGRACQCRGGPVQELG